jgi:hypothetical protein
MDMYPHLTQFPENRAELQRERGRRRRIVAEGAAVRAQRPGRFAMLAAGLRRALNGRPRPSLAQEC